MILGLTFKENCNDMRNTKVLDIVDSLEKSNIKTFIVDPYVDAEYANQKLNNKLYSEIPKNIKFEALIVAVKHDQFVSLKKKI